MSKKTTSAARPRVSNVAVAALPAAILVIFFISGTSALIDQIVWTRALYRIFGVTALAASTVLAAFMAGLALGSYFFGRLVDRGGSGLRMYAGMELAIAIITPLTPWFFRALQPVYSAMAGAVGLESQFALPVLRGLLCFAVLLPPTILMGGTLPVLAKGFLKSQPGRVTAMLYSINTWGAVFGCFIAGFILLGVLGETRSLLLASCGNLAAAIWAWRLAGRTTDTTTATAAPSPSFAAPQPSKNRPVAAIATPTTPGMLRVVYAASFANGFAALGLEVLWGRALGLLTDASVYAYTGIIGMFLVGIALGSRLAAPYADRVKSPMLVLGVLVMALGATLVAALTVFVNTVPSSFLGGENMGMTVPDIWLPFKRMMLAAVTIAPVTLLSGACFPFLVRLVITSDGREGRQLGSVYSINTIGGILGAILAGYLLLPTVADQGAFSTMALLYVASGMACLIAAKKLMPAVVGGVVLGAIAVIALPFGESLSRRLVSENGEIYKHFESPAGTVTAFTAIPKPKPPYEKRLLVNGTGMTVLCTDTKVMAHMPLMLHPNPQSILVICFGMGTTFRSAAIHDIPVTVVELQPKVPEVFEFFHPDGASVRANPKNKIKVGDGRNYLLLSEEKFSVITIDPAPPMYSAGTVNLYTKEFFELCRDHLDEDGIMSLWIPGQACLESDFRLILKTFSTVFNDYTLWLGPDSFGWYLVGSQKPIVVREKRMRAVSSDPRVREDLLEYIPEIRSMPNIDLGNYIRFICAKPGIDRYVQDERRIMTDDRPYTEFPWLTWFSLGPRLKEHWMDNAKALRLTEPPPPGFMEGFVQTTQPATQP